jgi:hypothetical protein
MAAVKMWVVLEFVIGCYRQELFEAEKLLGVGFRCLFLPIELELRNNGFFHDFLGRD